MLNPNEPIPKPLPCEQIWDYMVPVDGGRICTGCGKLVVDFRKQSWWQIEHTQRESILPVCGIYSDKQIDNWGVELAKPIPPACSRMIKFSAALLTVAQLAPAVLPAQMNTIQSKAPSTQSSTAKQTVKPTSGKLPQKRVIKGTVVSERTDAMKWPLACAQISVVRKSQTITTETDSFGRFALDITGIYANLPDTFEIVVTHPQSLTHVIKYLKKDLKVNNEKSIDISLSNMDFNAKKVTMGYRGESYGAMILPAPPKQSSQETILSPKQSKIKKWWLHLWKRDK